MFALDSIPALVKVFLTFGLILGIYRLKVHLGLALFIGAGILGLIMGLPPLEIVVLMVKSILEPMALSLLLIVALILVLSRLMSDSGQLERIVVTFSRLVRDARTVSAVMPALIGLLPMPGGALFSAPMVKTASASADAGASLKSAINYWFRHIWEYWWPLYPGVILAVSLLGVKTYQFVLVQAPLTAVAVFSGVIFLLRPIPKNGPQKVEADPRTNGFRAFFLEVSPILLVVLAIPGVAAFELVTRVKLPNLTSVFFGLSLCLLWVVYQNKISGRLVMKAILDKSIPPMLLLILGIMAYKGVLVESGSVDLIHEEMVRYGIPPVLLVLLMPFITGFITGICVAFVGASFPLLVPLLSHHQGLDYMAYALLAYSFGYMGIMLSPVHVCLLVTKDYFNASLLKIYRRLIGPVLLHLAGTLLIFAILLLLS